MDDMNELVLDFLQDIYYAEKASIRAMAKMAKSAEADELKALITEHRKLSENQVSRLGDVFAVLGKRPKGKQCAAMDGLIHEAEEAIEDSDKGPVLDAALIACAQAMEHYEMARYGALIAWMRTMGAEDGAKVLQEILDEEKQADEKYNALALGQVNLAANEEKPEEEPAPKAAKGRKKADPKKAELEPEPMKPEMAEPVAEEAPASKRKTPTRKKAAAQEASAAEVMNAEPEPEPEEATKPASKRTSAKTKAPAKRGKK